MKCDLPSMPIVVACNEAAIKRTYSHIDMDARKVARWRTAGWSVAIIAEKLGRHRSTIFRQIRRNRFIVKVVEVTEHARHRGVLQLELAVNSENAAALRFYQHRGFIVVGRFPNSFPGHVAESDELNMVQRLN